MTRLRPVDPVAQERLFRLALLVKALDGAVELLSAAALLVATPGFLQGLVRQVLEHHLLGGPHGALAQRLAASAEAFGGGDRTFAIVYLALHGVTKLGLVVAMACRVRRAYPVAAVVLAGFVAYELYRATRTGSLVLPLFAALDVVIVVLILREYRRLGPPGPGGSLTGRPPRAGRGSATPPERPAA